MPAQPALSQSELAQIADAVRAAEANTAGEIYVVVARAADEHRLVPILWAALIALLLPWPLHLLTHLSAGTILIAQSLAFILCSVVLSDSRIRPRIVPANVAAEAAHRAAQILFLSHGVHLTEARTGILIYVALAERRVEVIADSGIHAKVEDGAWEGIAAGVVEAARAGRLADGLIEGIGRAGSLLARHFPRRPDDRNELPDRVVEI